MKKALLILTFLIPFTIQSQENQEKIIHSKVKAVTVFLEGAQITRKKIVEVPKGITVLKFAKLSPFIDGKSIQVKSKDLEIQAVNFQKNYLKKGTKNTEVIALEKQWEQIQKELQLQRTHQSILKDELQFLKENRILSGKNEALSVNALKEAAKFYGTQLQSLKLKEITITEKITELEELRNDLRNQINNFTSKKEYATGEIVIKIKASNTTKKEIELVYNVANASWYPTYDVRVKDINSPLQLVYKANVRQNTKVDWNKVHIRFSSAEPNTSSIAPELKTYYLDYGSVPPRYDRNVNTVTGTVGDENGPLPGVSILVDGTTIGTETDFDGKYSLSIPKNGNTLTFSYLGYETVKKPIYNNIINVELREGGESLDEIVVVGYGTKISAKDALAGASSGVRIRGSNSSRIKSKKEVHNYSVPTEQIVNQTTVDFKIVASYSLQSDNKSYAVGMKTYNIAASYEYYSVPKIDKAAFLLASIHNWEQYNLLEGEANIYFEDTYIGKSLLDVRFTKDTLQLSLGRDKNVVLQRKKVKNYTTKQFIGNKKEETKIWDIDVKNNKAFPIQITVFDQVPVATREEIKIILHEISKGVYNEKSGKIKWNLTVKPNQSKKLNLKYVVKYPKNRSLLLD